MYALDDDARTLHSAQDTIAAQGNIFLLHRGRSLRSNEGRPMATLTGTSVAYYDPTIGGACSCEEATPCAMATTQGPARLRRELPAGTTRLLPGRSKRDMVSNINWFMNVPVEADGALGIVDGISAPGLYVDIRAEMDVVMVVSNCPQINNPTTRLQSDAGAHDRRRLIGVIWCFKGS